MVLRERGDRFLHLFGAGYANYVWTVFADAAEDARRARGRRRGARDQLESEVAAGA